uniref:Non-structural polyprotein pORF1 n=3 Tax=Avihepevirus magniiecur TaxID=1678144 RepID=A0A5S9H2M8_9VIRU|nr:nonstructural polyprotein [Avian hepatitis E virus]
MDVSQFAESKGVKTALEAAALAAAKSALRNARVVTPYLSQQQTKNLLELFRGAQLRFEPRDNWAHPVQRVMHDALEQYVRRAAGPNCLEVGAHPRSINGHHASHRCFLRPVGRDEQRWQVAPRRGLCNLIRRAVLNGVTVAREFCHLGFAACSHQCEVGIALYCLHDMRPADVACAMARHNMRTMYVVLHLPDEAMLPPGTYLNKFYNTLNTADNCMITYADDSCAGYVHNREVLQDWISTTGVSGRHPMVIERVRAIGCHFVLLCTATQPWPMPYTPYPSSTTVYVRNVYGPAVGAGLFTPNCCVEATFHPVPRRVWHRFMMFGTTLDDEAFCCSRLLTYLRGISTKVTVGNIVANEGWQPDEHQLTAVAIAAYLTICHQRWVRTQGIARGVRRLQAEHAQQFRLKVWELFTNTGTVPGYSAGFYSQSATWISGGLTIDFERRVFDKCVQCGCWCVRESRPAESGCLCIDDFPEGANGMVKLMKWPIRAGTKSAISKWAHVRVRADSTEDLIDIDVPNLLTLKELAAAAMRKQPSARPSLHIVDRRPVKCPRPPARIVSPVLSAGLERASPDEPVVGDPVLAPSSAPAEVAAPPSDLASTHGATDMPLPPQRGHEEVLAVFPSGARVIVGNLLDVSAEWLVNPANRDHHPGGGLCGMFHRRWPHLWPVCGEVQDLPTGPVMFQQGPPWLIHAPGPDYRTNPDPDGLRRVYAVVHQAHGTVASPLISAGIYRAPARDSFEAWAATARDGELLVVHRSLAQHISDFVLNEGSHRPGKLQVDRAMADMVNYGLATEPEPYNELVKGVEVAPMTVKYAFMAGVPGSGKSPSVDQRGAVVMTPTKTLRREWSARGAAAITPHVAASAAPEGRVIVDEAYAIPPHLLVASLRRARDVVMLGDPHQIPALDFEDRWLTSAVDLGLQPTSWRTVSHRCPSDVCMFMRAEYPTITTTSRVLRSVVLTGETVGQKIVFTQVAKQSNPGSITVHEAQGSTFDQTTIIATLDARGLIASSRAHAIVALTRHRERCSVIDAGGVLVEIGVTDAMFNKIEMQLVRPDAAAPAGVFRANDDTVDGTLDIPPAHTEVAAVLTAEAIGHAPLELAAIKPPGPELEQGLLYMPAELDGRDEVVNLQLSDTVHCRLAAPTRRLAVINTLVGRYGNATKLPEVEYDVMETVAHFWHHIGPINPSTLEYAEMCEAMVRKGQDGSVIVQLDLQDADCSRITFFQKDCAKFTMDEPVAHGKVGQGISAWPKTLCALFGPWFRAIEKHLVAGLPPGYYYGDLYTDADLHRSVLCAPTGHLVFENDFSEFDSTQNNVSLDLECELMRKFGMPHWMVVLYHLVRSYWLLVAPKEALRGCWKKHSGEPGTLLWNTVWNMTVLHHVYEFQRPRVVCFKGDDSVVVCDSFRPRPEGASLVADCGLKMKEKTGPCGAFSNLVMFPGAGVVCDLLRQWGRLTDKNWGPDIQRMQELELACKDFVARVVAQGKEMLTLQLVAGYYGVDVGMVEVVWGALKACAAARETLVTNRLPVLNLSKED